MLETEISAASILQAAHCGHHDVLADLVNKRLDIDFPDKSDYSKSALHKAAENGDIEAVKLLISYGADLNYRDTLFRATPLLLAAASGKLDVVEFLVKRGGEIDIRDAACQNSYTEMKYEFHIRQLRRAYYCLFTASLGIMVPSVYHDRSRWRRSPWHWAAANGHAVIIRWLFSYCTSLKKHQNNSEQDITDYIIAQINSRDWKKRTPLHLAVQGDHKLAAEVLLEYGTEVNCYDLECCTPLHVAVRKGYDEMVKLLLLFKADQSLTDRAGKTAIVIAEEANNVDVIRVLSPDITTR